MKKPPRILKPRFFFHEFFLPFQKAWVLCQSSEALVLWDVKSVSGAVECEARGKKHVQQGLQLSNERNLGC